MLSNGVPIIRLLAINLQPMLLEILDIARI
jgi:hypothetical protein